jgi:hypothetical protein
MGDNRPITDHAEVRSRSGVRDRGAVEAAPDRFYRRLPHRHLLRPFRPRRGAARDMIYTVSAEIGVVGSLAHPASAAAVNNAANCFRAAPTLPIAER